MDQYFEYEDRLNAPLEAFYYDASLYPFPILPHWHYFIEIIYLLEGQILVTSDECTYTLQPGDLICFLPKQLHSIDMPPASKQNKCDIKYHVLKFDLGSLSAPTKLKSQFSMLARHALKTDPAHILFAAEQIQNLPIKQLLEKSISEMTSRSYGYDSIVSSIITSLLTCLSRIWLENGLKLDEALTASYTGNPYFEQITEYIEAHYKEALRVQSLAKRCGMSYSYFAKSFRELYGRSCKEYIEFVRMNKVMDLLLFTNLDLNYISQETGFADCSHLIRTFKKYKGCTPKQWKRKVGTKNETNA